jgi:hypothetical protein
MPIAFQHRPRQRSNRRDRPRIVVSYCPNTVADHQRATVTALGQAIAALTGGDFGGEYEASASYRQRLYFVPSETLLTDDARAIGIRNRDDPFGGVVPFPFVATKSIVHPLVAPEADRPSGWSTLFPRLVSEVVLPGFTAFSLPDARRATERLLAFGPVRLKPGHGIGGHGQVTVAAATELEVALERVAGADLACSGVAGADLACSGVAVELELDEGATYSIGEVWVGGLHATYCGTQGMTTNNAGASAFGGSDIVAVQGGYEALARLPLEPSARAALEQARVFDAATAAFSGLFASRRNYDVLRGRDRAGRWRSGVLEQSWRLGGASGPELAALAAFQADPTLRAVRARCVERYGGTTAPPGAIVHFSGVDPRLGALVKYTIVEPYELAA